MIYNTFLIYILISLLLLLSPVYTSIARKHSTAHYSTNGTIYVLGGLIDATQLTSPSAITLRLNKKDFSLTSNPAEPILPLFPPTAGHTSHLHANSIISVFGYQQKKDSPPIIPTTNSNMTMNIPNSRCKHTSALINDDLYVIGGRHTASDKLIDTQDNAWKYSFSTQSWQRLQSSTALPSMAGHTTVAYNNRWLISCFGGNQRGLIDSCTWFDTLTLNSTQITLGSSFGEWPKARTYASMISVSRTNDFILFGGETATDEILDDLWQLHINAPYNMTWQKINYENPHHMNYKRSGYASVLIDDMNVVLYYGGQDGPSSLATDPIYLDTTQMEWIKTNKSIKITKRGVDTGNTQAQQGLSGGAIGGIIVGVIGVVALAIGFVVWRKYRQRQQDIHQKSRAARFSRSPSSMLSTNKEEEAGNIDKGADTTRFSRTGLQGNNLLSLPELALSLHNNNRISVISLGAEFRFSEQDYYRRRSQLSSSDSAILGVSNNGNISEPKTELVESHSQGELSNTSNKSFANQPESPSEESDSLTKGRESTGFKRLTLNLFSGSFQQQPEVKKKNRSSSLFQLRASRLLQPTTPTTPNTPNGLYPLSPNRSMSRASLGAKSVSSVQWVGFNDTMDYKGGNRRDSSASSMHLAVKNPRSSSHASLYYSDSAQSTPRSPMFPSHLRDSTVH